MKARILTATMENVRKAAEVVRKGGLVVYPTDTVYGLGCDPFNASAVKKLLQAKGQRNKPLPILARGLADIERIAELPEEARKLGEKYWPGPLTLVLRKKNLPDIVTLGSGTVGVRIPNSVTALLLLKLAGGLLVGTSANKSMAQPASTATEAYEQLKDEVDVIIDGGSAGTRCSSTVIDITGKRPKILRPGALDLKEF